MTKGIDLNRPGAVWMSNEEFSALPVNCTSLKMLGAEKIAEIAQKINPEFKGKNFDISDMWSDKLSEERTNVPVVCEFDLNGNDAIFLTDYFYAARAKQEGKGWIVWPKDKEYVGDIFKKLNPDQQNGYLMGERKFLTVLSANKSKELDICVAEKQAEVYAEQQKLEEDKRLLTDMQNKANAFDVVGDAHRAFNELFGGIELASEK